MAEIRFMKPAARFLKKIKDDHLKELFRKALENLAQDPTFGQEKTGGLAGIRSYVVYYNKTNYELAYTVIVEGDAIIVVIMAGTRENFYEELKGYMEGR